MLLPEFRIDRQSFFSDLVASIVVFLVALPLCMGIAIASGVPPSVGIITGVIGGLVVGSLSGAPLQVSGPAAGLVVLVTEISKQHGIETLCVIIVFAGFCQLVSGILGFGQWFRAVPPSVIHGMLSGIGLLLIASQFHVMFDFTPKASGLQNLLTIPDTIKEAIFQNSAISSNLTAAIIGVSTIVVIVLWERFSVSKLKQIPGSLIAILAVTSVCSAMNLSIKHVEIPAVLNLSFNLPTIEKIQQFKSFELLLDVLALAFIASAETMLTAAALDKMIVSRTDYDKELRAQGIGNISAGLLGLLPITGVIARSGVNVKAGAKTRLSSVFHGLWLIIFVALFPQILRLIPVASLAGLLVLTGYKLFLSKEAQELGKFGRSEVAIYLTTLISIVVVDLLTGVIVGVVLSIAKLLHVFSRLSVRMQEDCDRIILHLTGTATFLGLPKLAQALSAVPPGSEIHVHLEELEYIDHACLDLLINWEKQYAESGGQLVMDWGALSARFHDGKKSINDPCPDQ